MANTIHKYLVPIDDVPIVSMPRDARVLCVDTQDDQPYLWAVVDPNVPCVPRRFRMLGTGHPVPETPIGPYVGTVHLSGGRLVFHLFGPTDG